MCQGERLPYLAGASTSTVIEMRIDTPCHAWRGPSRGDSMGTITVGKENSASIELYYEDQGSGPSGCAARAAGRWTAAPRSLRRTRCWPAGYRVIAYDRRGFGRSSRPAAGYDFSTPAGDLDKLLTELDLRGGDPDRVLAGHRGAGSLHRYLRDQLPLSTAAGRPSKMIWSGTAGL